MPARAMNGRLARGEPAGLGKIGAVFALLVFGAGMWLLFNVIPFYYYALELEGQMEAVARTGQMQTDLEIRKFLMQKIKELEIPINSPEDLKIDRYDGHLIIDLEYDEILSIDIGEKTYDLHTFHFNPHVEQAIKEKKRR